MNKTFVSMLEALGYDIEIAYVKRNEKKNVRCKERSPTYEQRNNNQRI